MKQPIIFHLSFCILSAIDLIGTIMLIRNEALDELNPFAGAIILSGGCIALAIYKTLTVALVSMVTVEIIRRKRIVGHIVLGLANTVYGSIVTYHVFLFCLLTPQ